MRIFPELEFQPGLMKLEKKYEKIVGESEHKHPKEQAQHSIAFFLVHWLSIKSVTIPCHTSGTSIKVVRDSYGQKLVFVRFRS